MPEYIKPSEHVFIAGKTGTGKTWLTRKYLAGYKNVVCLDTKGVTPWPEVKSDVTIITKLSDIDRVETPKIIYRPIANEMNETFYNALFRWVYFRRNTIVWVDEVMSIGTPYRMPFFYKACLTRGRELGVGVWSLTQRPSGIPTLAMSEATHFMIFDLNMPQDRLKIAEITGMPEFLVKPSARYDKYTFWYHNVEKNAVVPAKVVETEVENG